MLSFILCLPFSSLPIRYFFVDVNAQARCMAAKTPKIATMGNLLAAGLTFIVGITFSFMGGYARLSYGPDSQFASFTVRIPVFLSLFIYLFFGYFVLSFF